MFKKNNPLIFAGGLILIIGLILWKAGAFAAPISPAELAQKLNADGQVVLYWGTTCPHCQETKAWMETNKILEKVKVVEKEVYEDAKNQAELGKIAQFCQLNPQEIGVPFMFAEGKCLTGSPDVEAYLAQKAGVAAPASANQNPNSATESGIIINPVQ